MNNETVGRVYKAVMHESEGFSGQEVKPEQDVTAGPLNEVEDSSYAKAILRGIQFRTNGLTDSSAAAAHRRHKPGRTKAADPFRPAVYMGTVDPVTVAERRSKNKAARKSRVTNARRARR